jgi:hypothetical protein
MGRELASDIKHDTLSVVSLFDENYPCKICVLCVSVVCDTMLQGLCKKLRMCGVDAIALGTVPLGHRWPPISYA